jgi:signal peptidase I
MPPDATPYPAAQPLRAVVEPRRRRRAGVRVTAPLSSILLAGVVLMILVAIAGMLLGAWRFAVIDTGSMRPTLNPGDVAVLTSEPTAKLRPGQIVAFHPPGEPALTVIHRVFAMRRTGAGVVIRTKGDANNAPDQWSARIAGATVWRESVKAPALGYLAVWSKQRSVRLGLLIVIVILGVSLPLGRIWQRKPS